jgi:hypothetical protein
MTTQGDVPPARSGQSMCQFGRHIFLFGGIDFENEAIYNDLYMLNTGLHPPPSKSLTSLIIETLSRKLGMEICW